MKSAAAASSKKRRPRVEEPAPDRRGEICTKARGVFLRYGYRKTTVEDIAKACGLVKGALYHYYASKEEILAEVVRVECERLLSEIRVAVRAAHGPRAKLTAMLLTRFKLLGSVFDEIIGEGIMSELDEVLPMAAGARQEFIEQETKLLEQILDEGQHEGVFKKFRTREVSQVIMAGIRGVEIQFTETRGAFSFDEGMSSMLELFFDGICK